MINYIDIQSCKALNETNKERIHKHQAELIVKVQEFEVFDKDDDEVSDEDYDDRHIADNLRIVSLLIKENNLLGLLITVEDCFIQKESFDKK